MKGRPSYVDEAAVTALRANLSAHRKSWMVIGAANIFLLIINFLFIGYFYAKYDQGKELSADFRAYKVRDDLVTAGKQLNAVDRDFADSERHQKVSATLADGARPFILLAHEEQHRADLIRAYLLQLKSFADEADETSEWLYLQEQRLAPLIERTSARAKIFMATAEKIHNDISVRVQN